MKKYFPGFLTLVAILLAVTPSAFAETRTVSWAPVTTYTDNTPIEAGVTVNYTAYWSTDAALSLASLHTIASSSAQTSATFDPDLQAMTRGQTVYFTAKAVLDTGEESTLTPAYSWVVPPATPITPTLSSISVSGPTSVNEGSGGTYTATATWSDNTTTSVTPTWSENSTYASISAGGVLTASAVPSNQSVTVTASYTSGSLTRTATRSVTIVDVPRLAPAAPKNIGITGPISTGPTEVWRIAWDPVTTYADESPLAAGRTVRYTPYWTDDPGLSAGSLRQMASSISATTFDLDPDAQRMVKNQVAYLTVRAILDNGDSSSLAVSLPWVVSNTGPVPPASGQIIKQQ